jgi:hypothetical protein
LLIKKPGKGKFAFAARNFKQEVLQSFFGVSGRLKNGKTISKITSAITSRNLQRFAE